VSQKTLNKPFEFVVIKSEELNNTIQSFASFAKYFKGDANIGQHVHSFPNLGKDAILIIPHLTTKPDGSAHYDYKNISQFTKNAPDQQQQELWQEVAKKLSEELSKGDDPR